MEGKIVAKRYAEAFVGYARETLGLERAIGELRALKGVARDHPELVSFVEDPAMTVGEKCEFSDGVLRPFLSEEVVEFVKLLIRKGRISCLIDIIDYIRTNYAHGEAVDALLKTAYPLDIEALREIEEKLEKKLKKKLHFYVELDGRLLGGVQVVVGNTVIDGTLRRSLDELGEKLKTARIG